MTGIDGTPSRWRFPLLVLALLLTAWASTGVFWVTEGWTGALFHSDYTIPYPPRPQSPLARAGFQVGDSVLTVEGIPVEELGMYSRWPKSLARAPGESITMVVERDGERVAGEIVYGERAPGNLKLQLGGLLIGLAFLWAGVLALFVAPSPHALRLAALGVAAGLALPGPSLGSWNGVRDHIQMAATVLWLLLLFRFFLFLPKQGDGDRSWWRTPLGTTLLFAPWGALLGCLVVELLYHPRFYHSFGGYTSLLALLYLLGALAAMIRSLVRLRPWRRTQRSLS